jgi:hypothetical protein
LPEGPEDDVCVTWKKHQHATLPKLAQYPDKRRCIRPLLLLAGFFVCLPALAGTSIVYDHKIGGRLMNHAMGESSFSTAGEYPQQGPLPESLTREMMNYAIGEMSFSPAEEYPQGPLPESLMFDKLLLEKAKRRLTAYAKGKAVRVYLVALGENPLGHKQFQGDKRTPEGNYTINDKNPRSAYYKNIGISYPNAQDRERAKKMHKSPGGDIKIHGLAPHFAAMGPAHRATDWTYGCIAVTNPEMEEIFLRTPVGIPIEILP